jgi:acetyltransferase-like isoleucine patch superfamily enzyme
MLKSLLLDGHELLGKALPFLRGGAYRLVLGLPFRRVGRHLKLRGARALSIGKSVSVGDACWIEAIFNYKGFAYSPQLTIGDHVSISDWTHISCAKEITIGTGCLIGSKVYIGDNSHGSMNSSVAEKMLFPADRPLGNLDAIRIGTGSWICDGVVVLAGTHIAPGSIVGANSVVRLQEQRPAVIVGTPAKVLRYLD